MITIRKSEERGKADHGWLLAKHTFSFADYYDPKFMGFRSLRVINEDRVQPGKGFGSHPHSNMEIITYVIDGAIAHKDSMGNVKIVKAGEVQQMSAGRRVVHSEFNPSDKELLHLLQIWILPDKNDLPPSYAEWRSDGKNLEKQIIASPDGRDGSIKINQSAFLYRSILKTGETISHKFESNRAGWLQIVKGEIDCKGAKLIAGDGAAIEGESEINILANKESEFLFFDLV